MSQIYRDVKVDKLRAEDYNIDMELPAYRIRVYKENITLNTQTSPEVELATVQIQFDRPTYVSYLVFFRQIMEDVVIKNLHPTETVAVELNTWLQFRIGDDVASESIPDVTIYDIPPGGTITLDITNNEMFDGIFYTIDNILIKMYIKAYIQTSGAVTDAEVFIPKTWMLFEL